MKHQVIIIIAFTYEYKESFIQFVKHNFGLVPINLNKYLL